MNALLGQLKYNPLENDCLGIPRPCRTPIFISVNRSHLESCAVISRQSLGILIQEGAKRNIPNREIDRVVDDATRNRAWQRRKTWGEMLPTLTATMALHCNLLDRTDSQIRALLAFLEPSIAEDLLLGGKAYSSKRHQFVMFPLEAFIEQLTPKEEAPE